MDPNPGRGMPAQLRTYWVRGKGAAKIRWGMPHDFNRCVKQLRKYFPKNPKGLCNVLHRDALGAPPGKGHPGEAALIAAAADLLHMQDLGDVWVARLCPLGQPTSDGRLLDADSIGHRPLPLPLRWQEIGPDGGGHGGAVTVGRILGMSFGPDSAGGMYCWGWGDWLNPGLFPQVAQARELVRKGVVGPSVDPGGVARMIHDPVSGVSRAFDYTIGGATLVPVPAFSQVGIYELDPDDEDAWDREGDGILYEGELDEDGLGETEPDGDEGPGGEETEVEIEVQPPHGPWTQIEVESPEEIEAEKEAGGGVEVKHGRVLRAAVHPGSLGSLPIAAREASFDADEAAARIYQWSGNGKDPGRLRQAFLWRDPSKPENQVQSYRLPVGDIINGKLTVIYHAIYAAAALLSGAHGGLPSVPDEDKNKIRKIISDVYERMASEFNDPKIVAPWDRRATQAAQEDGFQASASFATEEPYGNVVYADPGYQDDGKKRYPIDTAAHVRAAWSYINQADNAGSYNPKQLKTIKGRIKAAAQKLGVDITDDEEMSIIAAAGPVAPPDVWFEDPELIGPTPITVTPAGHVYGHLAKWDSCHRSYSNSCVRPPKSATGYDLFHLGTVVTAAGNVLRVGKIVADTGHAGLPADYAGATAWYDNTGVDMAVVRAGEDEHGIWVSGALVPEATDEQVARLRRSPLSGDWRAFGGNLELVAALAVNVPGFPVYAMDHDSNQQLALVAASPVTLDADDLDSADQADAETVRQRKVTGAWRQFLESRQAEVRDRWLRLVAATGEVPQDAPVSGEGMAARQADARFGIVQE